MVFLTPYERCVPCPLVGGRAFEIHLPPNPSRSESHDLVDCAEDWPLIREFSVLVNDRALVRVSVGSHRRESVVDS